MAEKKTMIIGPGIAQYPRLNNPDTKFDELGIYKADIVMSAEAAAPIMKALAVIFKAHTGKAPAKSGNTMWEPALDDEGEETGEILFKMRIKNRMSKKGGVWDRRPLAIDAKKKPLDESIQIWGGSTLKSQVDVYEWDAGGKKGVSLQPLVVQVLDLKTGSGAPDLGAFDEEDGYEGEDNPHSEFDGDEGAGEGSSEDGDY